MLSAASITAERQPFESTAASVQSGQLAASGPAITPVTDVDAAVEAESASVAAAMGWWRLGLAVRASTIEAAAWAMTWLRQSRCQRSARRPLVLSDKIQTLQSRCKGSSQSFA